MTRRRVSRDRRPLRRPVRGAALTPPHQTSTAPVRTSSASKPLSVTGPKQNARVRSNNNTFAVSGALADTGSELSDILYQKPSRLGVQSPSTASTSNETKPAPVRRAPKKERTQKTLNMRERFTCKKKPDDTKPSGRGSRPFVPWCSK